MIITKHKDFTIRFDTDTGDVSIETVGEETFLIQFKAKKIEKINKADGKKEKIYEEK